MVNSYSKCMKQKKIKKYGKNKNEDNLLKNKKKVDCNSSKIV